MAKAPAKKTVKAAKASPKAAAKKLAPKGREKIRPTTLASKETKAKSKALEPEIIDAENVGSSDDDSFEPRFTEDELRDQLDAVPTIEIDPDRDIEDVAEKLQSPQKRKKIRRSSGTARTPEIVEAKPSSSTAVSTTSDPIAIYLAEIRKYPLITREQEQELARRYRETGDSKAAELLVTSNLRFVVKIAAEYSRFGAKLIDLVQEGNVGLMHAVKEFNPYKGVRLITYAVWWIRGYIQEYLMRQYSLVRIGTTQNQRKLFYRLQKEQKNLDSLGQEPNVAMLAGRLGVTEEEVETMSKRLSGRDISLSQPVDGENSTATLLDFEASDNPDAEATIGHLEEMAVLRDNLEKIRGQLSEKERYILEKRVLSEDPLTLQEIGEHYGVTREAVRQLEVRLIGKIRNAVTHSLEGDDEAND